MRAYVLVDAADFEWLNQWRWCLSNRGYAVRDVRKGGPRLLMHCVIMGTDRSVDVDHVDGDGLNNRRSNLRIGTHAQNMQNRTGLDARNTSGYRGVTYDKAAGRWKAQAQLNGRNHSIGRFDTPEEANDAVVAWRTEHMPFARPPASLAPDR